MPSDLVFGSGADRNRTDDLLLAKQDRLSAVLHAVFAGRRRAKVAKLWAQTRKTRRRSSSESRSVTESPDIDSPNGRKIIVHGDDMGS